MNNCRKNNAEWRHIHQLTANIKKLKNPAVKRRQIVLWAQAIRMGRKFAGSELKTAYFEQAVKNIGAAKANQGALFNMDAA